MNLIEIFNIIFKNIGRRKLRSFLTILGIIIGSAAFIAIFNLGKATEEVISQNLERSIGSDVIMIFPIRFGRNLAGSPNIVTYFTEDEVNKIKKVVGVQNIYGYYTTTLNVKFKNEEYRLSVYGIYGVDDWAKSEVDRTGIYEGRSLKNSGEVILGYRAAQRFFKKEIKVGDKIQIENKTFKVVGILNEVGGILSSMDDGIFISLDDLKEIVDTKNRIQQIAVRIDKNYDIDYVANKIYQQLLKTRNEKEGKETFSVITPSYFRRIVSQTLSTLSIFLLAIASISLLVGTIGISNTMFTSVLERTKEIGILKAIGAKNRDILLIFLLEAAMIGVIGSVIGAIFGLTLSIFFQFVSLLIVPNRGFSGFFNIMIDYQSIFIAILIGFAAGSIAGYFPARRAAKLEAVEALRYE